MWPGAIRPLLEEYDETPANFIDDNAIAGCGAVERPATPAVEGPAVETPTAEPATAAGKLVRASFSRDESLEVSPATVGDLARGNNRFAFDFYHQVAAQSTENLIYSPYSISLAFSMVYAGAGGETAEQMAEIFHYLPQEAQHSAFNVLDRQIAAAGEAAFLPEGGEPFQLNVANAIYFKASRLFPLDEAGTVPGAFTLLDGSSVIVPLMHQAAARVPYIEGDAYQAVRLPYGGAVDMLVAVPAEGEFEAVEAQIGGELLRALQERAEMRDVDLTLPRFEFDTTLQLVELLQSLGLTSPFGRATDFSGMTESGGLFIADAVHKGTITVDEEGTEAAAVTGVAMEESAYPRAEVSVTRPFLFAIIERESGAIFFLGRVLNPAA